MGCPESVYHQGSSRQENGGPLQEKRSGLSCVMKTCGAEPQESGFCSFEGHGAKAHDSESCGSEIREKDLHRPAGI